MASTLTSSAAFDYCKVMVKGMPLQDIQYTIADDACKMIWGAAPWRWTVAPFATPVTLVANTQDYNITLPADFLYMQDAYLTNSQGDVRTNLDIVATSITGGSPGIPVEISITGTPGGAGVLRTYPKIGNIKSGDTYQIICTYKKQSPTIASGNFASAGSLVMDDTWFWVFKSGMLYYAYLYADDPRAGEAVIDDRGSYKFTGQRGVFESNIALMKEREKLSDFGGRLALAPKQP